MAFAKDYKEEITLAYYCFSLALTIAALTFGTIYLWHKDRRDQQRREWRQLAERIYSDYRKLKDKGIPRKISQVRDNFQKIQVKSTITGLDVLRYMLADANFEHCKTGHLESLRDDLQSIFQLFNVFSSLHLLGKVPKYIKRELKDVVTELGNIIVPFFKGEQRKIIFKCLEHFGSGIRLKPKTERRVRDLDARLEEAIPYVKSCLRFEHGTDDDSHYSQCSDFIVRSGSITGGSPDQLQSLTKLEDLEDALKMPKYQEHFERELQETTRKLKFDVKLNGDDGHEPILVKVLHEVRVYKHLCLNNQLTEQIKQNMTTLCDVEERVTSPIRIEDSAEQHFERFVRNVKSSISSIKNSESCKKLTQLLEKTFEDINILSKSSVNSLPSTSAKQPQNGHEEDQMRNRYEEIQLQSGHEENQISVQHGHEENQMQHGHAENQMQHGHEENQLQHGHEENQLQHGHEEYQMQHGHEENQMQHGHEENQMQHGHEENQMQHGHEENQVQLGHKENQVQHETRL